METIPFFKFPAAPAQEYTDLENVFSQSGNNTELTETCRRCLAKGEHLICKIIHDQYQQGKIWVDQSTPGLVSNADKSYSTQTHGASCFSDNLNQVILSTLGYSATTTKVGPIIFSTKFVIFYHNS